MRAASPLRQIERENEMIVISHRLFLFSRDRFCPKEGLKPIRCIVIVIGGDVILRLVEIGETDAHQGELGVEDEVIGPAALLAGGKISYEFG